MHIIYVCAMYDSRSLFIRRVFGLKTVFLQPRSQSAGFEVYYNRI